MKTENNGISIARNIAIKNSSGEYLCFIDSDDYIDTNLFDKLTQCINQNADLIKYKCVKVNNNYEEIERVDGAVFEKVPGHIAFNKLYSNDVLMDAVWVYLYKREFFIQNDLFFPENMYHEDWAVVPYSVLIASSVTSTDIYGYYYVQSKNSITRDNSDEKIYKRTFQMLTHYDNLLKKINTVNIPLDTVRNFKIYMSNCLILRLEELPEKYHKEYIGELKKRKIANNFRANNFRQFIKKCILKINIKLYLKIR